MKFKISKRARFNTSMLSGACIIALAIWGWKLPVSTAVLFFAFCVFFLVVIVALAALCGWLLSKLKKSDIE